MSVTRRAKRTAFASHQIFCSSEYHTIHHVIDLLHTSRIAPDLMAGS